MDRYCYWTTEKLDAAYEKAVRKQNWREANKIGDELDQRSDMAAGR